jgi:hypothetical protein
MDLLNIVENIMKYGLGFVFQRYYGVHRAVVTDNKDPDKLGRIKAVCTEVGQSDAPNVWILCAMEGAGNKRGSFNPPEVGDTVWIFFKEGDANNPEVYFGGWYGETDGQTPDVPSPLGYAKTGLPERRGINTRAGHALVFNDEDGKESITLIWNGPAADDPAKKDRTQTAKLNPEKNALFAFDSNGGLTIKTVSSHLIQIDEKNNQLLISHNPKKGQPANYLAFKKDGTVSLTHGASGSSINMSSNSIDVTGSVSNGVSVNVSGKTVSINAGAINLGGQPIDFAVLGAKLILWLAKHTHPYAFGVTAPPLPPPTPADFLSTSVKVQQ